MEGLSGTLVMVKYGYGEIGHLKPFLQLYSTFFIMNVWPSSQKKEKQACLFFSRMGKTLLNRLCP